jgi:uncharacterized protein CbrC (UPF0167 family)
VIGIVRSMRADLPPFRYHPDPISTGSVEESARDCRACGQTRGYIYVGPMYTASKLSRGAICPWCIADGSAASLYEAQFTDVDWGVPEEVPEAVLDEVSRRTPGFSAWQQDHWAYHCADACAYLGRAGKTELERHADAMDMLLHENDSFGWDPERSRRFVDSLTADGEATAHLFRCLSCGAHLAFSDTA